MNILVLGASGGCGTEVLNRGFERGHQMTAFLREQSRLHTTKPVQEIRGDVLEESLLEEALQHQDVVISCLGLNRKNKVNPWSEITSPLNLTSEVADLLSRLLPVDSKVIVISAAGVNESFSNTNILLKFLIRTSSLGPAYEDLEKMERILGNSNLNWMAVRPVTLTNGPATGRISETKKYGLFDRISRADVAEYIIDAAEKGEFKSRTPLITGS